MCSNCGTQETVPCRVAENGQEKVNAYIYYYFGRIHDNLEDKAGVKCNLGDVYDHYLNMCSHRGCNPVPDHQFYRVKIKTIWLYSHGD